MLARENRLKSADDFRATMKQGRKIGSDHLVIYLKRDEAAPYARFGFVVAKTVGGAVKRNLVKRRLRAIAREFLAQLEVKVDVVVRQAAFGVSNRLRRGPQKDSQTVNLVYVIWLAPRNLVVLFLKFYRKAISPLYGDVCRYYPTCSAYGLEQFQQRGVILGVIFTTFRILRCNPWSQGGVDRVKPGSGFFSVNKHGFVVPTSKKCM
jgi:putative membrane protein insertion efficiency factor/ribonuclease P protein component